MAWFYSLNVIDGPLPFLIWGLTAISILFLLISAPSSVRLWRGVIALVVGGSAGVATAVIVGELNVFGVSLPRGSVFWLGVAFGGMLFGLLALWEHAVWRKVLAVLLIALSALSGIVGINAAAGINRTVGAVFGVSTLAEIDELPRLVESADLVGSLYDTWQPPDEMPKEGMTVLLGGEHAIPSTAGFKPRNAALYLPPAALVEDPPRLPLIVMMMGYPGNPDPTFIEKTLNEMAAMNKGLAPIVIVADQLGSPDQDPACVDSQKYGGVSTYFNRNIPAYAEQKLNVILDRRQWTIMGYSNGGGCAFSFATHHPDVWGNLISISGDEFPGIETQDEAIRSIFAGDVAAFEANKPAAGIAANPGKFAGRLAIFTVGGEDFGFIPYAQRNAALAKDAGFASSFYEVPGADHVVSALEGGVRYAMDRLYPAVGLSAPVS